VVTLGKDLQMESAVGVNSATVCPTAVVIDVVVLERSKVERTGEATHIEVKPFAIHKRCTSVAQTKQRSVGCSHFLANGRFHQLTQPAVKHSAQCTEIL
jgi:hypothetical protein